MNFVWDIDWEETQGNGVLPLQGLNDIRRGILYKLPVIGIGASEFLPELVNAEIITIDWMLDLETLINACFRSNNTYFINHYNYDNWNGLIAIIPNMTRSAILSELGESEFPFPTSPIMSASWMFQQYKIINELIWSLGFRNDIANVEAQDREGGSEISAIACENDYTNNPWVGIGSDPSQYTFARTTSIYTPGGVGDDWQIHNQRSKIKITKPVSDFQASMEFFGYMRKRQAIFNYYSEDGYLENKMYSFYSATEEVMDGSDHVSSSYAELTENKLFDPVNQQNMSEMYNASFKQWPVFKWDGPNGF